VTKNITDSGNDLSLTFMYGFGPQTYCISCKPFGDQDSVYTLVQTAAAATVVEPDRSKKSLIIIVNKGAIRYDLVQGPFTVDNSYIVCPYTSSFRFLSRRSLPAGFKGHRLSQQTKIDYQTIHDCGYQFKLGVFFG
jgi:hypothetical protein